MVFRKQWRNNNQWFEWKQIERFGKQLFLSSTKLHSFVDTLFPASIQYFTRHPGFTLLKNLERPSVTLPFAVGAFVFFLVPILLSCTDTTFLYRHHALSQAKLAMERLNIEKIYHPFISGPKNETANQLIKVRVILATLAELRATWQRRSADAACHARIVSSRVPRRCASFKTKEALRSLPRGLLFSSYCRKDTMALPSGPMSDPSVTVGERIRIGRNLTGKNIMK